jgi:tetratricopeptide (TPR) repeat protein
MIKRLWRWFKNFWQRLFGRNAPKPDIKVKPRELLTDAEYESLFLQLLDKVNHESWSRGQVKAFLDWNNIVELDLVEWLRGFGERLLAGDGENHELAQPMVRLSEVGFGELSQVAGEIGKELLNKGGEEEKEEAEVWLERGYEQLETGDFEEAIESFDKAVEIKPDYHQAWYNRGNVLYELLRLEEAIASFDKAIEIKPDYYDAWNNRGGALHKLLLFEEAIASFDKVVEIKPDKHEAWLNRGIALGKLLRFEEAIASFDKAVEIKPDKHEAWLNRGGALSELLRFEEAIAYYDKAVEIKPDYYDAWNNRGNVLVKLLWLEEAIASYDKAIEIKPDLHQAWSNRGVAAGESISFNHFFGPPNSFTIKNPALNQRGYQGGLASYQEGLKYCQQDTHPEGWGKLHNQIGKAHYFQGVGTRDYRQYWLKAEAEYKQALITLTPETFPELHLQVLKDLIRVLFGVKKHNEAKQYRRQALEVFRNLLNSPDKSSFQKRKLQAEFYGFSQMRVDVLIEDGDFIPALETAERDKNFFLTWILDNQKEHILSPSYTEIKKLINPNTAIIYWHISPFALTTFIIQPGTDKPIVIPTQRTDNLEAWIKNWDKQYEDYRSKKQQVSNPDWRNNLPQLLEQLSEIINISHITETIQNSNSQIQNLVLIPHRDLHRLPLHGLFPDKFTINYLPSAQIGLTLNSQSRNLQQNMINSKLLIVEYSGAGREDEGLERLTYAQIESQTIARIFENTNSKHISDGEADKNIVKQALAGGYNIFHFSGHGSYDNKRPQNSAIYLNYDSRDTETNPDLTLPEIHNLDLKGYQLVSLSACETAITGNET